MDDPRYGTEPPENIPLLSNLAAYPGVTARVLAGEVAVPSPTGTYDTIGQTAKGPFQTVQDVQMVDFELSANATYIHYLQPVLNNCMIYVYKGTGKLCGREVPPLHVIHLDASDSSSRGIELIAGIYRQIYSYW